MNIIDIVLSMAFVIVVILYFWKGFISSFMSLIGLFGSLFLIARFGPMVKYGIMINFSISEFASAVLAYLLIFVMIAILVTLLKLILNHLASLLKLTFLNRVMGAVFGFFNMLIILILLLMLLDSIPFLSSFKASLNDSIIISETYKVYELIKYDIKDKFPGGFI